jgi:uncharacterized membrane protein
MIRKYLIAGLINLVVVILCAAVAIGVVVAVHWLLDRMWPDAGPHSRLLFSAFAPLGVVLFAFLLAQVGRLADRVPVPDWLGRRLTPG